MHYDIGMDTGVPPTSTGDKYLNLFKRGNVGIKVVFAWFKYIFIFWCVFPLQVWM